MLGKAWRQKHEAVGHLPSVVVKQSDGCWCPAHFLLFIQSKTLAHRVVLPTFKMGFLVSALSLWIYPHRHDQRCALYIILNILLLTGLTVANTPLVNFIPKYITFKS